MCRLHLALQKNIDILIVSPHRPSPDFSAPKNLKIKFLKEHKHRGINGRSYARNIGLENAKGDFIAFIDSDCTVKPNYANEVLCGINKIKDNKRIICLQGRHWEFLENSSWTRLYSEFRKMHALEHVIMEDGISITDKIDTRNVIISANVANRIKFSSSVVSEEDREFGRRLLLNGYKILWYPKLSIYHNKISLIQILRRQFFYGMGGVKWRGKSFWKIKKYYIDLIKSFMERKINFDVMLFCILCNFIFQLGGLYFIIYDKMQKMLK